MAKASSAKNQHHRELLSSLIHLDEAIKQRESYGHPGNYGLPDLLFPKGYDAGVYDPFGKKVERTASMVEDGGWVRDKLLYDETDEQYRLRQDRALERAVGTSLFILKDGRKVYIKFIPQLLNWVADVFFRRVSKAILWKPRGGGGSLSAAVLIWLLAVYRKRSILDVAGSAEQSKIVYDYVKEFWDCFSGLKEGLIDGEPYSTITRLRNGADIHCVPATEKQARGKHYATIFIDELCQENPQVEKAMRAALQGALSEPDPIVCLFSTFHIPQGLFQEYWDNAEEKGFTRYNWNVFDTMETCKLGLENSTDDDPKALEHCKNCFLTDRKTIKDTSGTAETVVYQGCFGQARKSDGWATFENVCEAKKLNIGTCVFDTEYACSRPGYSTCVYSPELIEDALIDPINTYPKECRFAVGIDWGIQSAGSLAITLAARCPEYVYLADAVFTDHTLVSAIADLLNRWRATYGEFPVIADSSHPFNNYELKEAGFDVRPVSFGTWKKIGIENVSKYLVFHRIKINRLLLELIKQLKNYRRSESSGTIIKKSDHGVDSSMCVMLNFSFEDEFGPDIAKAAVLHEQAKKLDAVEKAKFSTEGMAKVITPLPAFIPPEAVKIRSSDKSVLVF